MVLYPMNDFFGLCSSHSLYEALWIQFYPTDFKKSIAGPLYSSLGPSQTSTPQAVL